MFPVPFRASFIQCQRGLMRGSRNLAGKDRDTRFAYGSAAGNLNVLVDGSQKQKGEKFHRTAVNGLVILTRLGGL